MLSVAILNSKGGVGKSTVTALIGTVLKATGARVGCVDMDTYQESLTEWIEATGELELFEANKEYDFQLLDCPPRIESEELKDALLVADIVLLVTSSSLIDKRASIKAAEKVWGEAGKDTVCRVLFNKVQPNTRLDSNLDEIAEEIGMERLKSVLTQRTGYKRFFDEGWTTLDQKAKEEVIELLDEIEKIEDELL